MSEININVEVSTEYKRFGINKPTLVIVEIPVYIPSTYFNENRFKKDEIKQYLKKHYNQEIITKLQKRITELYSVQFDDHEKVEYFNLVALTKIK